MSDRRETLRQYLAIWNGEQPLDDLDALVTPGFVGHIGSRDRDLSRLKEDIAAYRDTATSTRFTIDHQFGDDEYLATRTSVHLIGQAGNEVTLQGINISRWERGLLAEEWAVWETPPTP
jgi:SnoaL-like domain